MRTLLIAAVLALALVAATPGASAHKDICSEPANETLETACEVRNAVWDYADCYLRDEGPLNWTQCV